MGAFGVNPAGGFRGAGGGGGSMPPIDPNGGTNRLKPRQPINNSVGVGQTPMLTGPGTPLPSPSSAPAGGGFGSSPFSGRVAPHAMSTGASPAAAPPISPGQPGGPVYAKPGNTSAKNLATIFGQDFNYKTGTQADLLNKNENALDLNNLQNSPLYKANINATEGGITSSYDQAIANARRNAIGAGFGYANPVAEGADTQLRGSEAGALAGAPSKALLQTVAPTLQAAQIRSGEMSQFNPDALLGDWTNLVNGKSAASSAMMSGLMQAIGQLGSSAMQSYGGGGGGG